VVECKQKEIRKTTRNVIKAIKSKETINANHRMTK
jgi:hypothetical protein